MAAGNPLGHVIQHPLVTKEADVGLLTPNGEITVLSDQITMMIAAGILLSLFLPLAFRRRRKAEGIERMVPRGFGNLVEVLCQFLRTEIAKPSLGEHTDRFIKYIWSVFFFVLAMNMIGLLPVAAIMPALTGLHIGGTPTSNIWVTGTLAICTLLMMVVNGIRISGKDWFAHLCPGPLWLAPLLVPVEVLGLFAKAFALAVRLFANMVAGHTLLAVLLGFILSAGAKSAAMGFAMAVPVVFGSVAVSLLEVFVAFLQAFIFTFLTTLFIGMSVNIHHDDHGEAHA